MSARGAEGLPQDIAAVGTAHLAAPLWANDVAHTGPDTNHLTEKIDIGGKPTNVVSLDGIPIGPGPHAKFLLGADPNVRDVMVRLMYGGRTSMFFGVMAAAGSWRAPVG